MFKDVMSIAILFFLFGRMYAQVKLNEVVVEAEAELNAIEEQKKALSSKIVISSKDLNNFGHHTVGDVLKRMPRIFVQGPPSFYRNIMMGGLDKQFQSVLINGQRPAGGEDYRDFKLDRIPADMVEEIEIIYNPPAEWGADASIGLVNIKLKDVPEHRILRGNIAFDHTSSHAGINPDASLTFGDNFGKLSFIGSYSFNQFNRSNINKLWEDELRGTEEENLNVHIHSFTGSLNYQFNERNSLKFRTVMSDFREELGFIADMKLNSEGELSQTADTANDEKHRRLLSYTLEQETKGENWKWINALNYGQNYDTKDRARLTQKTSGLTETLEDEAQVNNETYFKSDFKLVLDKHTLKAGARLSGLWRDYNRLVFTKIHGRAFWDDIDDGSYTLNEYRAGAYVSDAIELNKLQLLPSLRFDYDIRDYLTGTDEGSFNYTSLNPSLHTRYSLCEDLFLKADIARQISRPPFNFQVPVDKIKHKKQTIERGNKELLPSLAWNFNLGAEKYFKNNSYVTFRGFYSVLRDVIEKKDAGIDEDLGYQIIQAVNVDSGLVWGFDIDTRVKILNRENHNLSFAGNATIFGSQVRDASSGELRRLNEQPKWVTNGSLDYLNTDLKLQMSLGLNFVGERQIAGGTDEGTLVAPLIYHPFMQWDARVKYFFSSWGSVFMNVVNLLDERVETSQGAVHEAERVGRNIRLGVSMSF